MHSRTPARATLAGLLALARYRWRRLALAQDTPGQPPGVPITPFSQNKENEPAVAMDQEHPSVLAAGSNDKIDMEPCNADEDCTAPSRRASASRGSTSRSTPARPGSSRPTPG